MKIIGTVNGEGFASLIREDAGRVYFDADMDIDVDGRGSPHGDPYFQDDTSLHFEGRPLDSDVDKFIVVPPLIIKGVAGIVLGCKARVTNIRNGKQCEAVVGDIGPTRKTGEASRAVAFVLGVNPDPVRGGEDAQTILYELWPGIPALVDGRNYVLKRSG